MQTRPNNDDLSKPTEAPTGQVVPLRRRAVEATAGTARLSSWEPIDLEPILKGQMQPPEATILRRSDGAALLYPASVNLVYGETESAKSWLMLIATAQELAEGHQVVYLDYEDSPLRTVERLLELGVSKEQILVGFTYIGPKDAFGDAAYETVCRGFANRGGPSLVVVDSTNEAMTLDSRDVNSSQGVTLFLSGLPQVLSGDFGCCVTLIDHVTKSNSGRYAYGSERKLSGIDGAALRIETKTPFGRGRTGRFQLWVGKDRAGGLGEYYVGAKRWIAQLELVSHEDADGGWSVAYDLRPMSEGGEMQYTWYMEEISKALEKSKGEPMNTTAIKQAVGHKAQHVGKALESLVEEGYVKVTPGPKNSKLYELVTAYRQPGNGPGSLTIGEVREKYSSSDESDDCVARPSLQSVVPVPCHRHGNEGTTELFARPQEGSFL